MDVPAYFRRIGYDGVPSTTVWTLTDLHRAHATTIPFENLDIQLGRRISLEPAALEEKMVSERRGGYCFEHNTLAMHALRQIGFDVTPCEARVRLGATRVAPRTHMVLLVTLDMVPWLWDTGFGGETLLEPLRLDDRVVIQGGAAYRVVTDEDLWVLQMNAGGRWTDLYAFIAEAREPIDFEVANWYTSTHPDSHFVTTLTAQQRTVDGWRVLRNLTYSVQAGTKTRTREIEREDLLPLLREEFGLELPEGATFRAIEDQARVGSLIPDP